MKARRTYESWAKRIRDALCDRNSMFEDSILETAEEDWHHVRLEYQVYVKQNQFWKCVRSLQALKNGMLGMYLVDGSQVFRSEDERHQLRAFKRKEVRL